MDGNPQWEPLTDEERREAERVRQHTLEALREASTRPAPPVRDSRRFSEPLGLDADGNLQPPLTREEAEHNEAVRRRARGERDPE